MRTFPRISIHSRLPRPQVIIFLIAKLYSLDCEVPSIASFSVATINWKAASVRIVRREQIANSDEWYQQKMIWYWTALYVAKSD